MKKVIIIISAIIGFYVGRLYAQTAEHTEMIPSELLYDSIEQHYRLLMPDIVFTNKHYRIRERSINEARHKMKTAWVGRAKISSMQSFTDSIEYLRIDQYLKINKSLVLSSVKYLDAVMNNIPTFNFAEYTPNLEVLSISTHDNMIQNLPSKLRRLWVHIVNSEWDGQLPSSFFSNPNLKYLSIYREASNDKAYPNNISVTENISRDSLLASYSSLWLPVYLPKLDNDNQTLQVLRISIDISEAGNIDKITKFKGLKALGIKFSTIPDETALKKLSYIDYIIIEEKLTSREKVELLAKGLGK